MSASFASAASYDKSSTSASSPPNPIAYVVEGIEQLHTLWDDVLRREKTKRKEEHPSKTEAQGPLPTDFSPSLPHCGVETSSVTSSRHRAEENGIITESCTYTVTKDSFPRSAVFPFLACTSTVASLSSSLSSFHPHAPSVCQKENGEWCLENRPTVSGTDCSSCAATSPTDPMPHSMRANEEEKANACHPMRWEKSTKRRRTSVSAASPSSSTLQAEMVHRSAIVSSLPTEDGASLLPSWLSQPVAWHRIPPLPEAVWAQVEKEWKKLGGAEMTAIRKMFYSTASSDREEELDAGKSKERETPDEQEPMTRTTTTTIPSSSSSPAAAVLPERCQLRVVLGDIKRSLWNLYPVKEERDVMRNYLTYLLIQILYASPDHVHYTQGAHDLVGAVLFLICSFRERVAGAESTSTALAEFPERLELVAAVCFALMQTYWAPFASADLEEVQSIASAISYLLAGEHPKLYDALQEVSLLDHPHFMLSWMLTWFVSCLADIPTQMYIVMLFLKGEDALTPLYFSAALVLRGSDGLLSALQEFRQQCKQENISSWKDYVYGLLFQRISVLPSTLLEANPLSSPLSSSTKADTKKRGEEEGGRGVRLVENKSRNEEEEENTQDFLSPKGEDGTGEAAVRGAATENEALLAHVNTPPQEKEEEEEEEKIASKRTTTNRTRMQCSVSTSLLLMELRCSTDDLRVRYPLQRVDQSEKNGGGAASDEGNPNENTGEKRRSYLGSDGSRPLSSSTRRDFLFAVFYAMRHATLVLWRCFYGVLLRLSGILPPALLASRGAPCPSPPILRNSIVYVPRHTAEKPSSSSPSSSRSVSIFSPRSVKDVLQRLSQLPPTKAVVTISVVLVLGLSLLVLQQKKELPH